MIFVSLGAFLEGKFLEAVIGLPSNLFFGTGIPATIVIFNKGKKNGNVLFIDGSKEFENGKNQNKLRPRDIEHIVSTYEEEEEIDIKAVQTEIDVLETELKEVQAMGKLYKWS